MVWSDDVFANEVQKEWRQALPGIIAGEPDRTDMMKSCKRIVKGPITVGEIIGAVSAETKISVQEIAGPRSKPLVARARWLAMCLAHDLRPDLTYDRIAQDFRRERSTVCLAIKRTQELLGSDPGFAHCYQHVRWRLGLA